MKTPAQADAQRLVATLGSYSAAARELGLNHKTVAERVKRAEKWDHMDPAVKDAMAVIRTAIVPNGMWIKTKPTEDAPGYSVYLRPEHESPESLGETLRAALEGMTPAAVVAPPAYTDADLLTVYPIADAHFGMMAWGRETSEDWDTAKAAARLREWIGRCIASSPSSAEAIILDVGDTTHANDQTNQTPQSRHGLDVDTRFYKTMTTAAEALGAATEAALAKHGKVTVVILPGNHNRDSYIGLRLALHYRFRENPRVTVYNEPGEFWISLFGNAMIAAHHGDKAKPERIVMFLADQHPAVWGKAKHRFLWTGHLHHAKMQDIGGVQHEQLRAMTARDAYAVSHAYTARAQLQAITLHKTGGEIQRVKINA
jgi:hypothetical protein